MKDTFDPKDLALMLELGHALKRNRFTRKEIKQLSMGKLLSQVRLILSGQAKTEIIKPIIIDLDANPYVPDGWKVEEHKKGGQFEWDPSKMEIYVSPGQRAPKGIRGHDLRKELSNELVLNANLLDFLLENPFFIPDKWEEDDEFGNSPFIIFWGTIYRRVHIESTCFLCVRVLRLSFEGWVEHSISLDDKLDFRKSAAVRKGSRASA